MGTNVVTQRRPTVWQSILEAIRGTQQDFTEGSISRAVLLLATPMVLEMFMESLFAIVDVFWVTRLGSNAIATVGLTESMLTLVFSVAMGVSMSATAMVARRIGEKDPRGAATAAVQAIVLGVVLAVLMGAPGFWFAPQLLRVDGCAGRPGPDGTSLYRHHAWWQRLRDAAVPEQRDLPRLRRCFRRHARFVGIEPDQPDPRPLPHLRPGPFSPAGCNRRGGVHSNGPVIRGVYQLWILTRGHSRIVVRPMDIRVVPRVIVSLVRVSITGVMQFAIAHTSWIALVRIISTFGSAAVAGYTIGIRIFIFAILPSWGLSGAAATMVGQNLGAHKPERAERAVYLTGVYNMLFLSVVAAVFIALPGPIVRLFTADPTVAPYAVDCLRIIAYGNLAYAYGMVMVQAFNGAGDTVTPTIINVFGFWLCEIPLAWVLAYPAGLAVRGVFISIPVSELLITLAGLAVFMRGRWKKSRI